MRRIDTETDHAKITAVEYDRTVIGYHGCAASVAKDVLAGKKKLKPSQNDYDWLGEGIYFWEYGADRALEFAKVQVKRRGLKRPTYVGAVIQLGNCFDLMDTLHTTALKHAFPVWEATLRAKGLALPANSGGPNAWLRKLDCAFLNWYLKTVASNYDTVRCGFVEGGPAFPGSGIMEKSHVQLAIRNPACIVGLFKPRMSP